MEKFIKKVALHLIWGFIATNLFIYGFIKISPEYFLNYRYDYAFYNYHIDQIKTPSKYRNIIFGDSKGQTINPKILGPSWLNLGEHSSGFFQAYFTVKYYLENNKIDTLLFYFSPNSILGFNDYDYLSRTAIPSRLVEYSDLKNLEEVENKFGNYYTNGDSLRYYELLSKQINRELKYFHFPYAYSTSFLPNLSSFSSPGDNDLEKMKNRIRHVVENRGQDFCGDSAFNSTIYFTCSPENLKKECRTDPVNMAYLDSIVRITKANKIALYIAFAPINETTYKVYKNSVLEKSVNDFYKSTCLKYPNIHLITEPGHMPDSTFGDWCLHPNRKGSIVITNQIKEQLRLAKSN